MTEGPPGGRSEAIDDDLDHTANGAVDHRGFERLVSGLCAGAQAMVAQ